MIVVVVSIGRKERKGRKGREKFAGVERSRMDQGNERMYEKKV